MVTELSAEINVPIDHLEECFLLFMMTAEK